LGYRPGNRFYSSPKTSGQPILLFFKNVRATDFTLLQKRPGNRFYSSSKTSGLTLRPTQRPVQSSTKSSFREVKRPRREADHSPPSCAEVKNEWSYTTTSPYPFMVCKGRILHFYSLVVRRRTPSITLPYRVDCPRHTYVDIRRLPVYKRAGAQQMCDTESLHPPERSAIAGVLRRIVEENTLCIEVVTKATFRSHVMEWTAAHTHPS